NDGNSCSVEDEEHTNNNNNGCDKEEEELSVPRGGPIFVPNLVGSLTSVPLFQSSIVQELQDLEFEVSSSSSQVLDEDISVDELKILTEEELVDIAIKEAFKDNEDSPSLSPIPAEPSDEGRSKDHEASNDEACKKKSRKRKRTKARNHDLESYLCYHVHNLIAATFQETYIAKVEHVRRIKEKQDEDKAAVTLHSFNPSSKVNDCAITSSRTIDRMKPLRSASSAVKVKSSSIQDYVPVHYPEVALSIEVYHNARKWVKDTLCNDLRDPSAVDYSEPIFDWLKNSKDEALKKWEWIAAGGLQTKQKAVVGDVTGSQLPHFRAVDMHKTQFCDLKFRLGAGYLYCHQGDCRHTIVIRDMRLIHPQDVQNRAAYPILLFQLKPHIRKCYVCKIFRATQVTIDDKWAQENPCYFCDNCYYLLHYKDGRLLYDDFSVHEYRHD
ncbi:snRNA-activating protein complex subunit, partial [Prunus dulcis]